MKNLIIIFLILSSSAILAQTPLTTINANSTAGLIIQRLKTGNDGIQSFAEIMAKQKFQGYRICDQKSSSIDSLDNLLNNDQIESLFTSENGTLKFIGFILFARRNNNKEIIVLKFLKFMKEKHISLITDGDCNHTIIVSDLGSFSYDLIVSTNALFKPTFKLSKREKNLLKKRLKQYNTDTVK